MDKAPSWLSQAVPTEDISLEIGFSTHPAFVIGDPVQSNYERLYRPVLPQVENFTLSRDADREVREIIRYYQDVDAHLLKYPNPTAVRERAYWSLAPVLLLPGERNVIIAGFENERRITKFLNDLSASERNPGTVFSGACWDVFFDYEIAYDEDRFYIRHELEWELSRQEEYANPSPSELPLYVSCPESMIQKQIPALRERVARLLTTFRAELKTDYWGGNPVFTREEYG